MAFNFHLISVYIVFYLLSIYQTTAGVLETPNETKNVGFSWSSCGSNSDPLQVRVLSVSPDPIRLPGQVTVGFAMNLTKTFPADVFAKIDMQKKIAGIWIKVPCEHGVGSCTTQLCTNKTQIYPALFRNGPIPKCPAIPPGYYLMSDVSVDVKKSIPQIAEGEFKMNIDFRSNSAGHVTCLDLHVNLK